MKFRFTTGFIIGILIITSCVKSRVDHKYYQFYNFRPGKTITYNLNLNAEFTGSAFGFKIREKISKNLKIILKCIKYENKIFRESVIESMNINKIFPHLGGSIVMPQALLRSRSTQAYFEGTYG